MATFMDYLSQINGIDARRLHVVVDNARKLAYPCSIPAPSRRKNKKRVVVKECRWSVLDVPSNDLLRPPSRRQSVEKTLPAAAHALFFGRSNNAETGKDIPRMPRRRSSVEKDDNTNPEMHKLKTLLETLHAINDDLSDSSLSWSPPSSLRNDFAVDGV